MKKESQPEATGPACSIQTLPGLATVDLSVYSTGNFDRGAGVLRESLWLLVNSILFRLCPVSFSRLKCTALRLFGARIGRNVTIKPRVAITFPWKLIIGDHVWLGEDCWLQNLERISIGSHVCISPRAFLCTGSHNYKTTTFDLIVQPIRVEDGAWIAAGAWVGPGVTIGTHAVLAAGSFTSQNLEPYAIYRGNPAVFVKKRIVVSSRSV